MNKAMLKMKVSVLFVFLLLITVSISSVMAGTVTIDDDRLSTDDSDLVINFENGWIKVDNATIDNESINASVFNQWNTAYTYRGDLFYNASVAATIDSPLMAEWNSSYGWGDHSLIGYLTGWSDGDPFFNVSDAYGFTWTMAAGWNASAIGGAPSLALITNSNNNSWEATGANIILAVADLNATGYLGGNVYLPKGNYTTSETIYLGYNISLIGETGTKILPDGDFDVVVMYRHSRLENVIIDISGVVTYSNTSGAVKFLNLQTEQANEEEFDYPKARVVRDVSVLSAGQRGIGLLINPDHDSDAFAFNDVENFCGNRLNTSIKLLLDRDTTYINFNRFVNVKGVKCDYNIWLREDTTSNEISMNIFDGIRYEAESGGNEHYPIFIEGNCDNNHFLAYTVMDWPADGETNDWIYIRSLGAGTATGNYFTGHSLSESRITDESGTHDNSFYGHTIQTAGVNVSYLNRYDPGSYSALEIFKDTTTNPGAMLYGNVGGNDRWMCMRVSPTGDFEIFTEQTGYDMRLFGLTEQGQDKKLEICGVLPGSGTIRTLQLGFNNSAYPGGFITTSIGDLNLSSYTDIVTIDDVLRIKSQLFIDGAVDRWINDSSDNKDTLIQNSNGNYWTAIGTNIQLAINDLDNNSGIVWLPGNTTFTVSSSINIWYNITLDLGGSTIKPDSDFNVIIPYVQSRLCNGVIDATDVGTFNSACVAPEPYDNTFGVPKWRQQGYRSTRLQTSVDHIACISDANEGIGLYLLADGTNDNFAFCAFSNLYFNNLHDGILLKSTGTTSYVNGNMFSTVSGVNCTYFIHLDCDTNEISANSFDELQYQPISAGVNYHAVLIEGNCDNNIFMSHMFWDWSNADKDHYINITDATANGNMFVGASSASGSTDDSGTDTCLFDNTKMGIASIVTEYINRDISKNLRLFYASGGNPTLYVMGNDGGTDRYLQIYVSSGGSGCIKSEEKLLLYSVLGEIKLFPENDIVELHDILLLPGRTTDPPSFSDGMIWHNSTIDKICVRLNGVSYSLNMTAL